MYRGLIRRSRLTIAGTMPDTAVLISELQNFHVKIDLQTAHDSYNARQGQHDDLVLALCLAVWAGEQIRPIDLG